MPEYLPLFAPGAERTWTASATITAGQLCVLSGVGTVAPSADASLPVAGVAGFDAASGDKVTLYRGGVQRLTASGAVNAGDQLVAAAAGQVSTLAAATTATAADINNARAVVGIALTAASSGQVLEVAMKR